MILPVCFCFCFCMCMLAIGVFSLCEAMFLGSFYIQERRKMIRRSVHYIVYTFVKYLIMRLVIVPGLEHLIGWRIHCLRQVRAPACTSNLNWQQWRKRVWWGGSRRVSEVTIEHIRVGMCSRAPPMGGYDNIQTSLLRNTKPRRRGIIVLPDFRNGHDCLIYVLQGSF